MFHEIACVKDGNRVEGFLLADMSSENTIDESKYEYNRVQYVDMNEMKRLASLGEVESFLYNQSLDRLEIQLAPAELSRMKKAKMNNEYISHISTLSNWLKEDMIVSYSHRQTMIKNRNIVCGTLVDIQKIPLAGTFYAISVFGDMGYVRGCFDNNVYGSKQYSNQLYQNLLSFCRLYDNNGLLLIPVNYFDMFKGMDILIDTRTFENKSTITDMSKGLRSKIIGQFSSKGKTNSDEYRKLLDYIKGVKSRYGLV